MRLELTIIAPDGLKHGEHPASSLSPLEPSILIAKFIWFFITAVIIIIINRRYCPLLTSSWELEKHDTWRVSLYLGPCINLPTLKSLILNTTQNLAFGLAVSWKLISLRYGSPWHLILFDNSPNLINSPKIGEMFCV